MALSIKTEKCGGLLTEWWAPDFAEGAEFLLRPLDQLDIHELRPHFTSVPQPRVEREGVEIVVERVLKDWRNVVDGDGNELPCTFANARHIPSDILHLMAMHAINSAYLSEEDLKNSRAQSKSSETLSNSIAPTADAETDSPNGSGGE